MRLIALGIVIAALLSCSTNIHDYEQKNLSAFMQNMFPDGLDYTNGDKADCRMLEDKTLALFFTSVNNPQSLELEELLQDMAAKFHYRLSIVFINSGPSNSDFIKKMEKHGESFFVVSEKRSKALTKKFKVKVTPTLIVFGRDKKLKDEKGVDTLVQTFPSFPVNWD